jgi:hypothetical protein
LPKDEDETKAGEGGRKRKRPESHVTGLALQGKTAWLDGGCEREGL